MERQLEAAGGDQLSTVVEVVKLAAHMVLRYGGETYRAEETVMRICQAYGYRCDALALPTGVLITISEGTRETRTVISRVTQRSVDLEKIDRVNELSRQLAQGKLTLEEALGALRALYDAPGQKRGYKVLWAAGTAALFATMFRGDLFDFCAALVCGALVELLAGGLPEQVGMAASNLLGGFFTALLALMITSWTGMGHLETIIAGTIMPMLPGLAMTNAIRDAMRGDLVSGVARAGEALLRSVVLAAGAGVAIQLWMALGGLV